MTLRQFWWFCVHIPPALPHLLARTWCHVVGCRDSGNGVCTRCWCVDRLDDGKGPGWGW